MWRSNDIESRAGRGLHFFQKFTKANSSNVLHQHTPEKTKQPQPLQTPENPRNSLFDPTDNLTVRASETTSQTPLKHI